MTTEDSVQEMNALLTEVNSSLNLDIEIHPFWPSIIPDANSDKIGYKLHEKGANPDRIMSLKVHPLDFDNKGHLNTKARNRIKAEIEKFWDGKRTESHTLVDITI